MISIYMIFTTLAATTLTKGSIEINFSESGAQQCFGAVGQMLIFHLPNRENTEIRLLKDDHHLIFKIQKTKNVTQKELNEKYTNLPELFTNGTLRLGNATKRHTGAYQLTEYRLDGTLLTTVKVHLEIQAPVSKPAVSQMCVSPEQMNVSCSAEGDGVEFLLTLDGLLLIQTRTQSQSQRTWSANVPPLAPNQTDERSVSNVTIGLHAQLTGNLLCRVWNNVSREETVFQPLNCKDILPSFRFVTLLVIAGVIALLLAQCLYIISLHKPRRQTAVIEGDFEADVVYAAVSVK